MSAGHSALVAELMHRDQHSLVESDCFTCKSNFCIPTQWTDYGHLGRLAPRFQ